jgi:hypothetical protein
MTRRSGFTTGPDPKKPDLFHKKAEEILELGHDALTCISLGNVIHLVRNKLLVSWLFWGKDNILTNCTNLSDTIGPHLYR